MIPEYQDWDDEERPAAPHSTIAEVIIGIVCAIGAVALIAMSIADIIPK